MRRDDIAPNPTLQGVRRLTPTSWGFSLTLVGEGTPQSRLIPGMRSFRVGVIPGCLSGSLTGDFACITSEHDPKMSCAIRIMTVVDSGVISLGHGDGQACGRLEGGNWMKQPWQKKEDEVVSGMGQEASNRSDNFHVPW